MRLFHYKNAEHKRKGSSKIISHILQKNSGIFSHVLHMQIQQELKSDTINELLLFIKLN